MHPASEIKPHNQRMTYCLQFTQKKLFLLFFQKSQCILEDFLWGTRAGEIPRVGTKDEGFSFRRWVSGSRNWTDRRTAMRTRTTCGSQSLLLWA